MYVALIMGNGFFSPSAKHTIVLSEVRQVIVMHKHITYWNNVVTWWIIGKPNTLWCCLSYLVDYNKPHLHLLEWHQYSKSTFITKMKDVGRAYHGGK